MDQIENHQDLLNRFYLAEASLIGEYSSQIAKDLADLDQRVTEYAERNGLQTPVEEDG